MEIVSVNCNSCGAPLDVGAGTKFATCIHCGARLAIKRGESAAYTEILENLDRKTDAIAEQLAEITRQNELERIDREWDQEREKYLTTHKNGSRTEPSASGGIVMAAIAGTLGLIWTGMAFSMGAGGFALFGLVIAGFAVFIGINMVNAATKYEAAQTRYRKRRASVLEKSEPEEGAS